MQVFEVFKFIFMKIYTTFSNCDVLGISLWDWILMFWVLSFIMSLVAFLFGKERK